MLESRRSSVLTEDFDAILECPCGEDDEMERKQRLPSFAMYPGDWEPVIVYRKNKRKQRKNNRCTIHQPRIIQKTGRPTDFEHSHINHRYRKYLRDISNTMVNGRWRWVTLGLVLTFSALWLLFGWLWMVIAIAHGDMDEIHPRNDTCSVGIEGFAGFLLMSIETQTTIGYGSRYPTENCPEGVFLLCLQMIMSIGVEGAVLGVFYVKMTRPRVRNSLKMFSRFAVVCQRDGNLCLMFRASDRDRAHIVGTQIRAYLTEKCHTEQGERLEAFQKPLAIEPVGLLLWPLIIIHKITKNSPLYDVSARDLLLRKFEIIVTMTGCSDSTGQMAQSCTSYLASEIHWGHRFKPCVYYDEERHSYVVHEEMLSAVEIVDTPLCSVKRLEEVVKEIEDKRGEENCTTTSGYSSMRNGSGVSSPFPNNIVVKLEEMLLETDV